MTEIEYYSRDNIRVTNTRAIFDNKNYTLSNITSVSMNRKKNSKLLIGLIIFLGLAGLGDLVLLPVMGIMLIATSGLIAYFFLKPTYMMLLGSSSGEVQAYVSKNKEEIEQIVKAVNQAIDARG